MNYGDSHSMQAVNAWIRYIELFGSTEITVQKLINHGYDYSDIIHILEQAVNDNAPIDADTIFCKTPEAN